MSYFNVCLACSSPITEIMTSSRNFHPQTFAAKKADKKRVSFSVPEDDFDSSSVSKTEAIISISIFYRVLPSERELALEHFGRNRELVILMAETHSPVAWRSNKRVG